MPDIERVCPILSITTEERAKYKHIPSKEVDQILSGLGYGPTKMLVDRFYISPDRTTGVGVLDVTEERCRDHYGLFRGVDMIESMAQSYLLLYNLQGNEGVGRPLFVGADEVRFNQISTIGGVLNTVAQLENCEEFGGYAWTLRGTFVVAQAIIRGRVTSHRGIEVLIKRATSMQERTKPLFS